MKNLLNKIRDTFNNAMDSFIDCNFKYFTIEELTQSETAERLGIDNTPNEKQKVNMRLLIFEILDPLREAYGKPIYVNSGFRCEELNIAVGGALHSHHKCNNGYAAADITATNKRDNKRLFELIQGLNLPFCQLIWESGNEEYPEWIHISYNTKDIRKEVKYLNK